MVSRIITDDFECPFPSRATNWTISKDTQKKFLPQNPRNPLEASDIDGAHPGTTAHYRILKYQNKSSSVNVTQAIRGATSTRLIPDHVPRNKQVDQSLNNRDIEHSYPAVRVFITERVVNPLLPSYKLPTIPPRKATPSFCQRETQKLSDIQGTASRVAYTRKVPKDPLDYSDVPHSTSLAHTIHIRTTPSKNLTTDDICCPLSDGVKSQRTTNPVEPQYMVGGPSGAVSIGPIEKNKPANRIPANDSPHHFTSLRCDDIDGAKPSNSMPHPKKRRQVRNPCDISDISTKGRRNMTEATRS